jgi:hypothetical protein
MARLKRADAVVVFGETDEDGLEAAGLNEVLRAGKQGELVNRAQDTRKGGEIYRQQKQSHPGGDGGIPTERRTQFSRRRVASEQMTNNQLTNGG